MKSKSLFWGIFIILLLSLYQKAYPAISQIKFITYPSSLTAGTTGTFQLQLQDAVGNPVALVEGDGAVTIDLTSLSTPTFTSGYFSASSITASNITSVTISTGNHTATFYYYDFRAGISTITANAPSYSFTTTDNITVYADSTKKRLLAIVPGETHIEGWAASSGKSGNPSTQTAGVTFSVTVRVVDNYWNYYDPATEPYIYLLTEDPYDTDYSATPHSTSAGEYIFLVTLVRASSSTITATEQLAEYTPNITKPVNVAPGTAVKLMAIAPGETAVGGWLASGGKTGSKSRMKAGVTYPITVCCVDGDWNTNPNANPEVTVSTTDNYDTEPSPVGLSQGTTVFYITPLTVSDMSVTVYDSDGTDPYYTVYVIQSLYVDPGPAIKLQVIVPGETYMPGNALSGGKAGTPSNQYAGVLFPVTVNCVDAQWNIASDWNPYVTVTTSDPYDDEPNAADLYIGGSVFYITLRRAHYASVNYASHTITAMAIPDDNRYDGNLNELGQEYQSYDSIIMCNPVTSSRKLQILVPGETPVEGLIASGGKTGNPLTQTAGVAFSVTVRAIDANYNSFVPSPLPIVYITTTDPYDTEPYGAGLGVGTGLRIFSVDLVRKSTNTVISVAATGYTSDSSPVLTVEADTSKKYLRVLLPGETAIDGWSASNGKTGSVQAQVAGTAFFVTVNTIDAYCNRYSPEAQPIVTITTSDRYDSPDTVAQPLVSGTTVYRVILVSKSTSTTIMAFTGGYTSGTSAQVTVNANTERKLLVLVPGETAVEGKTSGVLSAQGKTGSAETKVAGETVYVTVRAVDDYWNLTNSTAIVTLTTSDPYDFPDPMSRQLSGGEWPFSMFFVKTSTGTTVTAGASISGLSVSYTGTPIPVNAASAAKLQILLPGQATVEGEWDAPYSSPPYGISGLPSESLYAGEDINVIVNALDQHYNRVPISNKPVAISCSDENFTIQPSSVQDLTSGTASFNIKIYRGGVNTIYATDVTTGEKLYDVTSSTFNINSNAAVKLQILAPGETAVPGSTSMGSGKTGTPATQTAGVSFSVTVRCVDNWWNTNTSATPETAVTTSDNYDTEPLSEPLVSGEGIRRVILVTKSTFTTVTATGVGFNPVTSPNIRINSGSATRLHMLVPGQIPVEGWTASGGRYGNPVQQQAGVSFNITVRCTDDYFNMVESANPLVELISSDPQWGIYSMPPASQNLISGQRLFYNVKLYTVNSSTSTGAQTLTATATGYMPNISAMVPLRPNVPDHLNVFGLSSTLTAGVASNVTVEAQDSYHNKADTYENQIYMVSNDTRAVLPATLDNPYPFNKTVDQGRKIFLNGVILKTANPDRFVKAVDMDNPYIASVAQEEITVISGAPSKFVVNILPDNPATVPAGGIRYITGQAADYNDNVINSSGVFVNVDITDKNNPSANFLLSKNTGITDSNGRIGGDNSFYITASTRTGDSCTVTLSSGGFSGVSRSLTVAGANAAYVKITALPLPKYTAGDSWANDNGLAFEVTRYDQYNNEAETGYTTIRPKSNSPGPYQIRNIYGIQAATVFYDEGQKKGYFTYYDMSASTPASVNGHPASGMWTITADGQSGDGLLPDATAEFAVWPGEISKVSFINPTRTLMAGTPGIPAQPYIIQTQDRYNNPQWFRPSSGPEGITIKLGVIDPNTSGYIDLTKYSFSHSSVSWENAGAGVYETYITSGGFQSYVYLSCKQSTIFRMPNYWKVTADEFPDYAPDWQVGISTLTVNPAPVSRIGSFVSSFTITAGYPSGKVTVETQDEFGNISPLTLDQGAVNIPLVSTSTGALGGFFSLSDTEWSNINTVQISTGGYNNTFYYMDYTAGISTITVDEMPSRNWSAGEIYASVRARPPYQIRFANPPRRLVAGTTVQVGLDDTSLVVKSMDIYGNVSPVDRDVVLFLYSNSPDFKGKFSLSIVPAEDGSISWAADQVTLSSGTSSVRFWYKDDNSLRQSGWDGEPMISVIDNTPQGYQDLQDAYQEQFITPNAAYSFIFEHSGKDSVKAQVGVWTKALDYYGNYARGDEVNGRYYLGTASFSVSGSAIVVEPQPPYHTFQVSDRGAYQFKVYDTIQEDVYFVVQDTTDIRIMGTSIDDNNQYFTFTGGVINYTDYISDENFKLYRGEGNDLDPESTMFVPKALMMLRIKVKGEPGRIVKWQGVKIWMHPEATIPYQDITELSLYRDIDGDGKFDPEQIAGGIAEDLFISSATYINLQTGAVTAFNKDGVAQINFPNSQIIADTEIVYFITARISQTATPDTKFGLRLIDSTFFAIDAAESVRVAENNFEIKTATITILKSSPPRITLMPEDINGWVAGAKKNEIDQGEGGPDSFSYPGGVGVLRFGLKTNMYTATLDKVKILLTGTALDSDIEKVMIYRDGNGSQQFEPPFDVLINSTMTATTFKFSTGTVLVDVIDQVITSTPTYFFVSYKIHDSAVVGNTFGAVFTDRNAFTLQGGNMANQMDVYPFASSTPRIKATEDMLVVETLNADAYHTQPEQQQPTPAAVFQGDKNVPLVRFHLKTTSRTAVWNRLRVDLAGKVINDNDIDAVKIWKDNGDWILDTSSDTLVSSGTVRFNNGIADIQLVNEGVIPGQEIRSWNKAKVYFMTYDVNYFATISTSNPFATVADNNLGLFISSSTLPGDSSNYFKVASPDYVSFSNFPFRPYIQRTYEYADKVGFTGDGNAPVRLEQGTTNYPMARLRMFTDKSTAKWTGINIRRTGTATDNEVKKARIWKDQLPYNLFNSADTYVAEGRFINGLADIVFSTVTQYQVITCTGSHYGAAGSDPQQYWITVDIEEAAFPEKLFGVKLTKNDFTVTAPNLMNTNLSDFETSQTEIIPTPQQVSVWAEDVAPATGEVTQGDMDVPFIKLNMRVTKGKYFANWLRLKLLRRGLSDPDTLDTDVSRIKIYREASPPPETPAEADRRKTFQPYEDILVSTGTSLFSIGVAGIPVSGGGDGPGYERIMAVSTMTYWIVMDISKAAMNGNSIGIYCPDISFFTVNDPNYMEQRAGFSFDSSTAIIQSTVDGLVVRKADTTLALTRISQATNNFPMARLEFEANQNTVILTHIRVDRKHDESTPGALTGIDPDVSLIKIYEDTDSNLTFTPGPDKMISYGADVFNDGTALIELKEPQTLYRIDQRPAELSNRFQSYFVVYDINPLASIGKTFGLMIANSSYFTVSGVDYVQPFGGIIQTYPTEIMEYADIVSIQVENLTPMNIMQGDSNVALMKLTMWTDTSDAIWQSVRIIRSGTNDDADIKAIKIYKDSDFNGVFDRLRDSLISLGTDVFKGGAQNNPGVVYVNITTAVREDKKLDPTPRNFFVVADVALTAISGHFLGVKWDSNSFFIMSPPNTVFEKWVDARTLENKNYPFESRQAMIGPVSLSLKAVSVIPFRIKQGSKKVAAEMLTLNTSSHSIVWNGFRIFQTGDPISDGDINKIYIYEDSNGNGQFEPDISDRLISSVAYSSGVPSGSSSPSSSFSRFTNFEARLDFATNRVTISTRPVNYFVAFDVYEEAQVNRTIGLRFRAKIELLSQDGYFDFTPLSCTFDINIKDQWFDTALTTIVDKRMPDRPEVKTAPWTNDSTRLRATFKSEAVGGIAEYQYAVGTSSGDNSNVTGGWFTATVPANSTAEVEETVGGLLMNHGGTYFFNVRAKSNAHIMSEIGSAMTRVNLTPPVPPASEPVLKGGDPATGRFVISWPAAIDPECPIASYEIQEREDNSPVWKSVAVVQAQSAPLYQGSPAPAMAPQDYSFTVGLDKQKQKGHFYYYRVRAKNEAGDYSPWKEMSAPVATGLPEEVLSKVSVYPNPFHPGRDVSNITFLLNQEAEVKILIFDLNGELVKDLSPSGGLRSGANTIQWTGINDSGEMTGTGGYICYISVKSDRGIIKSKIKIMAIRQ